MTIYVVQENPKFDYSGAEEFGDLKFLVSTEYRAYSNSKANDQIRADIVQGLVGFRGDDYLLLTGNPITMAYAFHVAASNLAAQGVNHILLLRWDNMQHSYVKVNFPTH